jgi:hypothetical protein
VSGDFGAIEAVVALIGAVAVGSAGALRALRGPGLPGRGAWANTVLRGAPALSALFLLLALGWVAGGVARGLPFDQGLGVGALAAAAMLALDTPADPDGPGPAERPLPGHRAAVGVGAAGLAVLAVLAALLVLGPNPTGLFGVAVGAGLPLALGEPASRLNGRLRFAGLVTTLAAATAFAPEAVILRVIVPDALLLPLMVAAFGTAAGAVGLLFDQVQGPYAVGVPAAAIAGVGFSAAGIAAWMPWHAELVLAVAAGWLGVGTAMYLPRWAVFEAADAADSARAGVALGVIGSLARGLRATGVGMLGFGVAVLIGYEAMLGVAPAGAFGVVLAASSAATGAAVLGTVRAGAGPGGSPRRLPEGLDVLATGWAGLAVAFSLPTVIPTVSRLAPEILSARLGLGTPATLAGLVLGAIVPFLLASAGPRAGTAAASSVLSLRWAVALVPAVLALGAAAVLGPSAVVGLVLGAALTGVPLGIFWSAARETSASLQRELSGDSADREALESAMDPSTGWRVAAAVLATALGTMAVAAFAIPTSGLFGL